MCLNGPPLLPSDRRSFPLCLCLITIYYLSPLFFVSLQPIPIFYVMTLNCPAVLSSARRPFPHFPRLIEIYYLHPLLFFSPLQYFM
jgi:hypothetical protein